MARTAMAPVHRQPRTCLATLRRAATLAIGAIVTRSVSMGFVAAPRLPALLQAPLALRRRCQIVRSAMSNFDDPYLAASADTEEDLDPTREALERDVQVTDMRDLNELLKLPNPMRPSEEMQLKAITLDDGKRIERPNVQDLRKLKPSKLRPVTFHWRDRSKSQTRAPKQYDDIIQRLLNAGPADMEDLVRSNWKMFDKGFFFRLTELKQDAVDGTLRERITYLEKVAMDIVAAAQAQMRKSLPVHAKDARQILDAMLEPDGATLLWPPPAEAFTRLAEAITLLATRAQYEDSWFESMLEITERYAKKMEVQGKQQLFGMALVIMQRLITEWFRHDGLWEETDEGQFIFRLMSLTREQWPQQLFLELKPLDTYKLRDELKIISENKVVQLPMGSKLQIYAAKYLQELVDFVERKDDLLKQRDEAVAKQEASR